MMSNDWYVDNLRNRLGRDVPKEGSSVHSETDPYDTDLESSCPVVASHELVECRTSLARLRNGDAVPSGHCTPDASSPTVYVSHCCVSFCVKSGVTYDRGSGLKEVMLTRATL